MLLKSADVTTLRTTGDLSEEDHYRTMLVQTEVERVRFVVRSYVRTRLFKVRSACYSYFRISNHAHQCTHGIWSVDRATCSIHHPREGCAGAPHRSRASARTTVRPRPNSFFFLSFNICQSLRFRVLWKTDTPNLSSRSCARQYYDIFPRHSKRSMTRYRRCRA